MADDICGGSFRFSEDPRERERQRARWNDRNSTLKILFIFNCQLFSARSTTYYSNCWEKCHRIGASISHMISCWLFLFAGKSGKLIANVGGFFHFARSETMRSIMNRQNENVQLQTISNLTFEFLFRNIFFILIYTTSSLTKCCLSIDLAEDNVKCTNDGNNIS